MPISVFQMFKIGIGPSASHTMGPMRAARMFLLELDELQKLEQIESIRIELYGSLALTGVGHGSDKALLLGLCGYEPHTVDPDRVPDILSGLETAKQVPLLGRHIIGFEQKKHLVFYRQKSLPLHANGMRFVATGGRRKNLLTRTYYSFGGGFVATEEEAKKNDAVGEPSHHLPYPFHTADELLKLSESEKLTIAELMRANEATWHQPAETDRRLDEIWQAMDTCIERGMRQTGLLPGSLKVKRRAAAVHKELTDRPEHGLRDPLTILDWVNLYALAVNEENASGARVVTAPTNGAAGVMPAVIRYYQRFCSGTDAGIRDFLLTAAAIGTLYQKNASISGAEVGCQGEVGVACSMAAAGLAAVLGGTTAQVEQAAEIAMEHNLGLTCDPIGGLVQIPCIERNAMGAVKAINAARIALRGDGQHFVSLDSVIRTMQQTGKDMKTKYKETSRGGLAVNVIEC